MKETTVHFDRVEDGGLAVFYTEKGTQFDLPADELLDEGAEPGAYSLTLERKADITVSYEEMTAPYPEGFHVEELVALGLPRELAEGTTGAEFEGVMRDAARIAEENQ